MHDKFFQIRTEQTVRIIVFGNIFIPGSLITKCVECNFDVQKDFERTKPNLGLTPQQVAEMAKRGIPVSPMNVNFIDVNGDASWNIEPQFCRDMDMATAWEMEKASQRKALQVLRQKKFGDKYINPQNN